MDPDTRYRGRIIAGSHLFESNKGTLGYRIMIGFDQEETEYDVWLTDRNRDRAIETFAKFGIEPKDLMTEESVTALAQRLIGKRVSFSTKADEYNGVVTVRVSWIDAYKAPGKPAAPSGMVAFFKGSDTANTAFAQTGDTSSDIPF